MAAAEAVCVERPCWMEDAPALDCGRQAACPHGTPTPLSRAAGTGLPAGRLSGRRATHAVLSITERMLRPEPSPKADDVPGNSTQAATWLRAASRVLRKAAGSLPRSCCCWVDTGMEWSADRLSWKKMPSPTQRIRSLQSFHQTRKTTLAKRSSREALPGGTWRGALFRENSARSTGPGGCVVPPGSVLASPAPPGGPRACSLYFPTCSERQRPGDCDCVKTPERDPDNSHRSRGPESAERLNPSSEPLCPRNTGSGCETLSPPSDADNRRPWSSERAAGGRSRGSRATAGSACCGDKLGCREGAPQPACLGCPGPALGPCRPLRPATRTGGAPWRTVRAQGPGLHAAHNTGLRGAGLRQRGNPHWTRRGLQTGRCRPNEGTHSPWTPRASRPSPLARDWTGTDTTGHAAKSKQRAACGPRNVQSRFRKAFKGHKK